MASGVAGRFEPIMRWLRSSLLPVILALALPLGCATEVSEGSFDEPDPDAGSDAGDRVRADTARTDTLRTDTAPLGVVDSGPPPPPAPDGGAPPPVADDLQHCVDVINAYRAKLGRPPYTRSSALEAFAAEGAKEDSVSGSAHGHFMDTSGGGIAWAENEIPGWSLDDSGSVRAVLDDGLKMMWDEGPGGGHYENMSSRSYKEVGCGIHVTASNDVWIVQDFR